VIVRIDGLGFGFRTMPDDIAVFRRQSELEHGGFVSRFRRVFIGQALALCAPSAMARVRCHDAKSLARVGNGKRTPQGSGSKCCLDVLINADNAEFDDREKSFTVVDAVVRAHSLLEWSTASCFRRARGTWKKVQCQHQPALCDQSVIEQAGQLPRWSIMTNGLCRRARPGSKH